MNIEDFKSLKAGDKVILFKPRRPLPLGGGS